MKRKKSFDNLCIFICCTLPSHFTSFLCGRVCVRACIKALASHSGLFSCPSYISLSLPSPSLLHQPPCHLPLFSVCAFLPYLVFSPKVFRCITPPHASRYAKVTHPTRNTELCAAVVAPNLFSYQEHAAQVWKRQVNKLFCGVFITTGWGIK